MTDHDAFAQTSDPARQYGNLPAPQPDGRPGQYAPPQQQPPAGSSPAPYGYGHPGAYGAQPYAPAYPPQYGMPVRTANGVHVAIAWIFAILTLAYMLPWAIAATRAKSNAGAIAVLNFFVGWTVIGWIVALVMACSAEQAPPVVIAYPQQPPYYPPTGH